MRIGIYTRGIELNQLQDVQMLMDELAANRITPVIYRPFYEQIRDKIRFPDTMEHFETFYDLDEQIECFISLGGDGTLLDTVTLVRDKKIPILGINFGRLGFLAGIGREEVTTAVASLINRTYVLDRRTLIHLDSDESLFGEIPYALNEFAIHKKDTSPMIKIHTYLNGAFLNTYWADGLIVATATGSTGYNLSCNGPVIFPDAEDFVITPVAPHNLNVRPIVVPNHNIISFEVEGRSDQFICVLDARKEVVSRQVQLAVKKESFSINLLRLNENDFLQTLRSKLSWGFDKRN
jgi:NAD+ kinase